MNYDLQVGGSLKQRIRHHRGYSFVEWHSQIGLHLHNIKNCIESHPRSIITSKSSSEGVIRDNGVREAIQ